MTSITKVLNKRIDTRLKEFFVNIGVVFIFRAFAAALNMLALICITRYFGVEATGSITLIQNTAYLIVIPITCGVNYSIIKYYESCKEDRSKGKFLGSTFISNSIILFFVTLVCVIGTPYVTKWFHLSNTQWLFSIALMLTINAYNISDAVLRVEKKFFYLGLVKLIGTVLLFAMMLVSLKVKNYNLFNVGLCMQFIIVFIASLGALHIGDWKINKATLKQIYSFGSINMLNQMLAYLLFSTDLFIINYFCSAYEVGLYSIYQVSIRNIFNIVFNEIFAIVFLPTIANMDKISIYKTVRNKMPIIALIAFAANLFLGIVFAVLYGQGSNMQWKYIILVAVGIGLYFVYSLLNSIFIVEGKKGAMMCVKILGLPAIVLVLISICSTMKFGIVGMMYSNIITQLTLISLFIFNIKRSYLRDKD